jgi:hypothetical protein
VIDEALATERVIEPSDGFTSRVMNAVRSEQELAPLPFPWKRIAAAVLLMMITLIGETGIV